MANFVSNFISDRDIPKLPFNMTRRKYHWSTFPWMMVLPDEPGKGDIKYYNLQGTQGYAGTSLSAAWAGGAATGILTVADSSLFRPADKAVFCTDNTNAAQMVQITAVTDATHVTISSLDGVTLVSAKANSTRLSLGGSHEDYETYHRGRTRMPTREYNVYEKILKRQVYPINVIHTDLNDETPFFDDQLADVVSQWKQAATEHSIIGEMVDPTTSANGEAAMAGLDQILAGVGGNSYVTTLSLVATADKMNLRRSIQRIRDNGGFPDNMDQGANVCLCNSPFTLFWMGLDDDKEGISDKETDAPFNSFVCDGVRFRLVEDKAMTEIYGDSRPTAFFLTMRENGKKLVNWIHIPHPKMTGAAVQVDQASTCVVAVEAGQVATLDVKDQFKHMFFRSNADLS